MKNITQTLGRVIEALLGSENTPAEKSLYEIKTKYLL
jgi:hypothetical protein